MEPLDTNLTSKLPNTPLHLNPTLSLLIPRQTIKISRKKHSQNCHSNKMQTTNNINCRIRCHHQMWDWRRGSSQPTKEVSMEMSTPRCSRYRVSPMSPSSHCLTIHKINSPSMVNISKATGLNSPCLRVAGSVRRRGWQMLRRHEVLLHGSFAALWFCYAAGWAAA